MAVKLCNETLNELSPDVAVPAYDRAALSPGILHIGVGNFHRAHQAVYLDKLFNTGRDHDWAIVGAGVRPGDAAMRARLEQQDWLTTVVELDPAGLSARVTGAMIDFVEVDAGQLIARLSDPAIRIVSLTITEGGYYVDATTGGFNADHPEIRHDAANPEAPATVFGILIAGLLARRAAGAPPFTLLSCDNLPENGHVTRQAMVGLARLMVPDEVEWIDTAVAYPNSMVDCITPATSDRERKMVAERFGIVDSSPVACEPFRQWVLEDNFPQGRPALEDVGAEFVADVAPYELMKLRILNGGHACIAYPGALLGHHFVHDAMADPDIAAFLDRLQRDEIIPVLTPIAGFDYAAYLDVVKTRFANPEVGDTVPRLCFDGSNRQPKFILPSIADALEKGRGIEGLALEVALWCRYCEGEDEAGKPIEIEDTMAGELTRRATEAKTRPEAFLENEAVFGKLAGNADFNAAFARQLARLWTDGTRATLRAYIQAA
ncbi:MAG: mannitol dehydrogenase family protein [Paracoccaceae bacterium]